MAKYCKNINLIFRHLLSYQIENSILASIRYRFQPTLNGDLSTHPQLWARVVGPKATRFWCCRWIRGVGLQTSGASARSRPILKKLANLYILPPKGLFMHQRNFQHYSWSFCNSACLGSLLTNFSEFNQITYLGLEILIFDRNANRFFHNFTKLHIWPPKGLFRATLIVYGLHMF